MRPQGIEVLEDAIAPKAARRLLVGGIRCGPAFDLIVISELAYYLDAGELETLAARITGTLAPDGMLLACHWRWPFAEAFESAETVHALFDARCGLTRLSHHEEADLLIDVWSRDARSVAEREGLL